MAPRIRNALALAALALTGSASALTVTPDGNANSLAAKVLGPGLTLVSASYQGGAVASGEYSGGPLGIPDGIVLTSGDAANVVPGASTPGTDIDEGLGGFSGCETLAGGAPSYDASVLTLNINIDAGYLGVYTEFVFASDEYPDYVDSAFNDVFGVWVDGTQIAYDSTGAPITINGPFFNSANVLTPPASGSNFLGSTPLLQSGFATTPGAHQIQIAVCDISDHIRDSGVFITLAGCTDATTCKNGTVLAPPPKGGSGSTGTITSPSGVPTGPTGPYGNSTGSGGVDTIYTTLTTTITSCPVTPCHPTTSTYVETLTKTVVVPCTTSTLGPESTTTIYGIPITTYVPCGVTAPPSGYTWVGPTPTYTTPAPTGPAAPYKTVSAPSTSYTPISGVQPFTGAAEQTMRTSFVGIVVAGVFAAVGALL